MNPSVLVRSRCSNQSYEVVCKTEELEGCGRIIQVGMFMRPRIAYAGHDSGEHIHVTLLLILLGPGSKGFATR